ncbi:MAG: replicative DNA helicase [Gemmatimonadota bacterium]|nr:replicative DNA helicase [Gemmatimonadota bacterium]
MTQGPIDNHHLERMPPQAIEIEQAVLGAMMLEQRAVGHAIEILAPICFYNVSHSRIFEAMISLYERNLAIDQFILAEELKRRDQLNEVGGTVYLTELAAKVATAANIDAHARIVLEKALSRRLIKTASDIIEQAYKVSGDVLELINRAEQQLFSIGENWISGGIESLESLIGDVLEQSKRAHTHNKASTASGVNTGFADLNECTSGLQRGDLIVLAACPGVGKTALALTLARNAAVDAGAGVLILSPKMSKIQVVQRLLSIETKVDLHKLCTGRLRDEDWIHLTRNIDRLAQAPIFIDDTPSISVIEARAKARRLQREYGIGMVVIDYLQLMNRYVGTQSREQDISHILRRLKDLAKELDVPLLALVQLSCAVESRKDSRPQLSDLPKGIKQAVDVVMFLYRPDMYGLTSPDDESLEGIAEIIIAKQRNGPPGSVYLMWNAESATYESIAPE